MTNAKLTPNDLRTLDKAIYQLVEYTSVFEHTEENREEWNELQETIRELSKMQRELS